MRQLPRLFAMLLLLSVLPRVAASQTGSITVTIPSGGTVTLHQVAYLDGSGGLVPLPEFSGCDLSTTAANARALADFALTKGLNGVTRTPDDGGIVRFLDLSPGLYLIRQTTVGEGYQPFSPFLAGIPTVIGDFVCYDVDASPKVAALPTGPQLPQTGQLRWPVPVLALGGVTLILLGRRGRRGP